MLKLLDDQDEIRRAQTVLLEKLKQRSDKQVNIKIIHQGGPQQRVGYWSKELDLWWATKEKENQFWNAFGTGEPKCLPAGNRIKCEINPPKRINRRISGAFAKDSWGNLHLLHRGKFSIGKKLFKEHFMGNWVKVKDEPLDLAFVASFNDTLFVEQIAEFVHEVERIKSLSERLK